MSRLLANYCSSDDDESDHEIPTIPAKRPPSPDEKFVPADPSASLWLGTAKKQKRDFGPVTFVVGDLTKDDDADALPSPPRPVTGGAKRGGGAGLFAFLPAPKNTSAAGGASSPLPSLPEPSASSAPPAPALSSYPSATPSWPLDPAAPHPSSAYAVAHPSEAYAYNASSSSSSRAVHPPAPTDDDVTQQLGVDRSALRKLGISDKQLRHSSIAVRSVNVRESLAAEDLEQVSQAHLAAAPKPINQAMSANTKLSIMALAKKAVSQQGDMEQMFSANRVKKQIASKKYGF
ncbi:hypothetical protein AMAG_09852 [Allomyces macrogynus ATCC 38327]|uniref:Proline-rich protein PRCC n=1 Tax=Allomyces macrogynus (strain ATCC 38327) TaxID=578462 RepID=A0A0L0STM4_ALLM3|nr:hypothetical protein AMAG_09852 [Allomyces macrogynus ATCC 38327]|eukprot:KNE65888.1 hypothetical protein AMAG_09852 [Allomyces macrogynus ATCC 38327]